MFYLVQFLWEWVLTRLLVPSMRRRPLTGSQPAFRCGMVWSGLPGSRQIYEEARNSLLAERRMRFSKEHLMAMRRCHMIDEGCRLTEAGASILNNALLYREVFPHLSAGKNQRVTYYMTA